MIQGAWISAGFVVGGMIQYGPIERSFAEGKDLYFIYCVWVHGYKQGRGNFQKRGMGKTLLQASEEDAQQLGAKGMAALGVSLPFWMRASWFKKQGYRQADKRSIQALMWKPFTNDAVAPKWIPQQKTPERIAGQVTVTAFKNGWCQAQNIVYERAKRATEAFDHASSFSQSTHPIGTLFSNGASRMRCSSTAKKSAPDASELREVEGPGREASEAAVVRDTQLGPWFRETVRIKMCPHNHRGGSDMQFLVLGYDGTDDDALARHTAVRDEHLAGSQRMPQTGSKIRVLSLKMKAQ